MRAALVVLLVLLMGQVAEADTRRRTDPPAGGGGKSFSDSFDRANNSDLNINCGGGDNACGKWQERHPGAQDLQIASNALLSGSEQWRLHLDSSGETDTLSQYTSARYTGAVGGSTNTGPVLRDDGGTAGTDEFCTLRFNGTTNYSVRTCEAIHSCETVSDVASANLGDGTAFASGDSLGFAVDGGTGDSIKFSLWKWENQAPPARGSWGPADWTVCSAGCDQGFTTAPSLTAAGPCDTGKRTGIYSGNTGAAQWDDFSSGDNP